MANPENKQIPYESTQKDIRDAIESVATAIGGITHPDAEDIVYDNSVSGLSATDVQNAIDEVVGDIPTVNDATLTIQKNGTTIDTFTANSATNKTVNVTVPTATSDLNNDSNYVSDASYVHTDNNFTSALLTKLNGIESGAEVNVQSDWSQSDNTADDYIKNKPSSEVKSATGTFTTVNGGLLEECNIELEPVQDLHGYDSPWVGGAGKNKVTSTVSNIKSLNTHVTWNGNIGTSGNLTYEILTDSDNNVIGIRVKGFTDSNVLTFNVGICNVVNGTQYKFNGCPSGGGADSYRLDLRTSGSTIYNNVVDNGSGATFTADDDLNLYVVIRIVNSYTLPTDGIIFYPMVRLGSIEDDTFEPYSNICPITGHTEVDLLRCGKNWFDWTKTSTRADGYVFWNDISVQPSKTYTLSFKNAIGDGRVFEYDSNGNLIIQHSFNKYLTFTTDSKCSYIDGRIGTGVANPTLSSSEPMLELGSTATSYEPYLGHLYQVQIGQTVYGGTVDVVSGVLTVDRAIVDLGSLTWNITETSISGIYRLHTDVINDMKPPVSTTSVTNAISDCYKSVAVNDVVSANEVGISVSLSKRINVYDTNYDTASSLSGFRTFINGKFFCYELITPFTIQLTPQQIKALVGQNNLSCPLDGQSIQTNGVEYREVFAFDDVEKVVSLRVPISMLGTDESGRTTASKSYTSGDYFYKDGYMCKALTSISAGATLTLNTNYSQGTLADVLKAIENA